MIINCVRLRCGSKWLLTTILVCSACVLFLRTLLVPYPYRTNPSVSLIFNQPIEIDLDVGREIGNGSVVQGGRTNFKLDPDSQQSSEPEPAPEWKPTTHEGRPLGKHTITDGLLVVNPDGPHPIFQLIRDAEAAWEAKLARASKTLDEAVAEYKRRYRQAPPLGFDKWWDYVVRNDIQLPDEYDEIFEDIQPFLGIDPAELALTQRVLEVHEGLVTVQKTETHPRLEVIHSTLQEDRQSLLTTVDDILHFVREVEGDLPPLRMTFSPFDNPDMFSDWRIKTMALEAAANGTTLTRTDLPPITEAGWIQACPPDSPARQHPPIIPTPSTNTSSPTPFPKTFIASHRDAMNPCTHPSLLTTHGQFLAHKSGPFPQRTLVPRFSLCSTLVHHDIRPPVPYGWDYDADPSLPGVLEWDVPWERKVDERLGWRGLTTGIYASSDSYWIHGHRERLVTMANALEGNVSILGVPKNTNRGSGADELIPVGEPKTVRLGSINPGWMDIAFAGRPVACDQSGGACEEMETLWEFRRMQHQREEGRYKFILDVDGNGWSGRFKRLMTSNALVFKATIYPEWYTSRIVPWVHYVPIQVSYADLYDAVAFFREHDDLAARIAKAGQDWSLRFWRRQDMTAYLYRLLLEYARVMSSDRVSMDYLG